MPIADMPQSNKEHAVPQQVMSVDFKLIGDLTMRQFAYVFIAGILAYLSYVFFIGIFRWPIVIFIAFFGLGFAFIPVQERGMDEWIANFFKAINMPTQRIWKKEPVIPTALMYDDLVTIKQELITLAPTSSRRKLEEYLKYQSGTDDEDDLDFSQKEQLEKVRKIFPDYGKKRGIFGRAASKPSPAVFPTDSVGVQPAVAVDEPEAAAQSNFVDTVAEVSKEPVIKETPKFVPEALTGASDTSDILVSDVSESAKPAKIDEIKAEQKPAEISSSLQKRKDAGLFHLFKAKEDKKAREEAKTKKIPSYAPSQTQSMRAQQGSDLSGTVILKPITPDMHTGRKFTNLLPSQGELILPIRGERVLRTSEQITVEESMAEKARKLQELLKKIREQEGIRLAKTKASVVEVVEKKEQQVQEVHDEAKEIVGKLKSQSDELSDEITRLKKNIQTTHKPGSASETQERLLHDLQSKQQTVEENYRVLSRGIQSLKSDSPAPETISSTELGTDTVRIGSSKPNTIQGVVKDNEGKIMTDVLLIIKNEREEPVRALKTDSLGRFELLSSLGNGKYTIETKPSEDSKLSFEKISVELKGEIVPPLVISGK